MRQATKHFQLTLLVLTFLLLGGAQLTLAENRVDLGCPAEIAVPGVATKVAIPVYISSDDTLSGFTLGFNYNSADVEIDSFSYAGTAVDPSAVFFFKSTYFPADNEVLIGWTDFTFSFPLAPQNNHLLFTLYATVPAGAAAQCIDIDTTWIPPAGDFIFAPKGGGQITPNYYDCGTQDINIGGGCDADLIPPVAVCTDVTVEADGNCQAAASIDDGSYDPEGQTITLTQVPAGPYPLGATLVKLIVTDEDNKKDTCEATVTVEDHTAPVLTCPGNITQSNDPGQCGAIVNFTATAADNCGIESLTYSTNPGTLFPIGTTSIVVIAADASGNADTCGFDVTVNDTEAPTANCPGDITTDNDAGQCGAVVNFSISGDDNCGLASVVATPASGSFFDLGSTQVEVIATDNAGIKDTCYFNVTVNDTEDPVIACPADIDQGNDPGECGAVVTYSPTASDNCPGVSVAANPPSGSFFDLGVTTVEVVATDAADNADTCFFDVTISDTEDPVIDCPADTAIQLVLGETETEVLFDVTASDNCPGVSATAVPPSGSIFALGETTVNCTATDGAGNTANCSFKVTVIPPNYPPEAYDTAVIADEDAPVAGQLQASDPESDALTYVIVAGPYNGTLTAFDANTGAFTYLSNLNFNGLDSMTFKAKDLTNQSNVATVRFTVNPTNDEPVARDTSITTAEDTPVSGHTYGYDIDGDDIDFSINTGPTHGTLTSFDEATGAFTYEPDKDYFGPDQFTFEVAENITKFAVGGTVSITVTPVNDAPVAEDDAFEVDEDQVLTDDVTATDVDDVDLTYEIVDAPSHGTAAFGDPSLPTFTYDSDQDYNGDDSFTYHAYDGDAYSNTATISITVRPINDPPVARDSLLYAVENMPGNGVCQAYDVDGDPLHFEIDSGPFNGSLSDFDANTGSFIYLPDPDFLGDDSIAFSVTDEEPVRGASAMVRIKVVEPAFFAFDPDTIMFTANEYGPNPEAITQEITSASPTGADFEWRALISSGWLALSDSAGTTPSSIDYMADIGDLLPGTYTAEVYFEVMLLASGLGGGPRDTVVVILNVENPVSYDSVIVGNVLGEPGEEVFVPIYARNSAPTKLITIPIAYDPDVVTYNYIDLSGTRIDGIYMSAPVNPFDHVISFRVDEQDGWWLEPGAGLIAYISFTINEDAGLGEVSPLLLPNLYEYFFKLDQDHFSDTIEPVFTGGSVTVDYQSDVDDNGMTLPYEYSLNQNYPNPFNPETVIEYALPKATAVHLTVYNLLGQAVRTLVDEYQAAGQKQVVWDGTDANGLSVGSGIYFYRLTTAEFDMTRKMVLMK